ADAERPEGMDLETDSYAGGMDSSDDEEDFEADPQPPVAPATDEKSETAAPAPAAEAPVETVEQPIETLEEPVPEAPVAAQKQVPAPAPAPVQEAPAAPVAPPAPSAPVAPAADEVGEEDAQRPAAAARTTNPQTGLPEPTTRPTITLADRQKEIQEKLRRHRE